MTEANKTLIWTGVIVLAALIVYNLFLDDKVDGWKTSMGK
jgi:hypothetical protein